MSVINRVPQGLLPLLDAKTLGRTPSEFSNTLQATLDLKQMYLDDIPLETVQATAAGANALGAFARVTVPDGELWAVQGLTARGDCTFGGSLIITYGITPTAGVGTILGNKYPNVDTLAVGDSAYNSHLFSQPVFFGPGTFFDTRITEITTAVVNAITTVMIHRLST